MHIWHLTIWLLQWVAFQFETEMHSHFKDYILFYHKEGPMTTAEDYQQTKTSATSLIAHKNYINASVPILNDRCALYPIFESRY